MKLRGEMYIKIGGEITIGYIKDLYNKCITMFVFCVVSGDEKKLNKLNCLIVGQEKCYGNLQVRIYNNKYIDMRIDLPHYGTGVLEEFVIKDDKNILYNTIETNIINEKDQDVQETINPYNAVETRQFLKQSLSFRANNVSEVELTPALSMLINVIKIREAGLSAHVATYNK